MSNERIRAYNTANGLIVEVPKSFFDKSEYLVEAAPGDVAYDPNLYTPKTAKEFEHVHTRITEPALDFEEFEVEYDEGQEIE